MAGATADALRDALEALSDGLDPRINALPEGDPNRAALEKAQNDLEDAASEVDAASIEAILTQNTDLQKIADLTAKINANAAAIAASQTQITKITAIAGAAVKLGELLTGGGTLAAILGAAGSLSAAIG
jgi:hypothetical protein